MIILKVL